MKKIKFIISTVLLIIIISSCEKFFSTTREVELPEHQKKLAVFSNLYGNTCDIFISHSKAIDDSNDYKIVKANVTILKNNEEFFSFIYPDDLKDGNYNNISLVMPQNINEGEKYTLEVTSDELGTATAEQIVPQKPVISNFQYTENATSEFGDTRDKLDFDIVDPSGYRNYYFFTVEATPHIKDSIGLSFYISTDDPVAQKVVLRNKSGILISDKTFDGKKRKLSLKIEPDRRYWSSGQEIKLYDTIIVGIKGISKDYYNFLISKIQYNQSNDNPFAEPVNIYSNIENGYGLFSVENSDVKVVKTK